MFGFACSTTGLDTTMFVSSCVGCGNICTGVESVYIFVPIHVCINSSVRSGSLAFS